METGREHESASAWGQEGAAQIQGLPLLCLFSHMAPTMEESP